MECASWRHGVSAAGTAFSAAGAALSTAVPSTDAPDPAGAARGLGAAFAAGVSVAAFDAAVLSSRTIFQPPTSIGADQNSTKHGPSTFDACPSRKRDASRLASFQLQAKTIDERRYAARRFDVRPTAHRFRALLRSCENRCETGRVIRRRRRASHRYVPEPRRC